MSDRINPNSESYPFLSYAQRFNLNYGHVLAIADMLGIVEGMENAWKTYGETPLMREANKTVNPSHRMSIKAIVVHEEIRRKKVIYADSVKTVNAKLPIPEPEWKFCSACVDPMDCASWKTCYRGRRLL